MNNGLRTKLLGIIDSQHDGEDGLSEVEYTNLRNAILNGTDSEVNDIAANYGIKAVELNEKEQQLLDLLMELGVFICPAPDTMQWYNEFDFSRVGRAEDGTLVLALLNETITPDEPDITWTRIRLGK